MRVPLTAAALLSLFLAGTTGTSTADTGTTTTAPTDNTSAFVQLCDFNGSTYTLVKLTGPSWPPGPLNQTAGYQAYHNYLGKAGDIIPPFYYLGKQYSQNWNVIGAAIFFNGCQLPAKPTNTPTNTPVVPTGGIPGTNTPMPTLTPSPVPSITYFTPPSPTPTYTMPPGGTGVSTATPTVTLTATRPPLAAYPVFATRGVPRAALQPN